MSDIFCSTAAWLGVDWDRCKGATVAKKIDTPVGVGCKGGVATAGPEEPEKIALPDIQTDLKMQDASVEAEEVIPFLDVFDASRAEISDIPYVDLPEKDTPLSDTGLSDTGEDQGMDVLGGDETSYPADAPFFPDETALADEGFPDLVEEILGEETFFPEDICLADEYTPPKEFVKAEGTSFTFQGKPLYFAGANNYYLFYKPLTDVQEVLDSAQGLGLTVIRTWGFCDGICADGNFYAFQPFAGEYSEETFVKFDNVIQEASDHGLKLIIPLVNNWNNFGGMCQYVKWCGVPNAAVCDADEPFDPISNTFSNAAVHDAFYVNDCTRELYQDYVAYFLNRTNSLTGIKYRDDPTIFAWELANEPRARSDKNCIILNNWIGEMSAFIKSIDPDHLVTPGGDGGYKDKPSVPTWSWWYHGNEGQDFISNHQWDTIDFATFRYYPEPGKFDGVNMAQWIQEHVADAHATLGKPLVMEEFGSQIDKAVKFDEIYGLLEVNGVNGDLFWMLASQDVGGNDGYFIFCPQDLEVCNVISSHADFMNLD